MNREIKFQYVYKHHKDGDFQHEVFTLDQIEERSPRILSDLLKDGYTCIAKREFTNLADKNGREIYDGDIVKHKTSPFGCPVIFWGGAFRLGGEGESCHTLLNRIDSCEVIGNIFENGDLLSPPTP
jgi:hypothetical protein